MRESIGGSRLCALSSELALGFSDWAEERGERGRSNDSGRREYEEEEEEEEEEED